MAVISRVQFPTGVIGKNDNALLICFILFLLVVLFVFFIRNLFLVVIGLVAYPFSRNLAVLLTRVGGDAYIWTI